MDDVQDAQVSWETGCWERPCKQIQNSHFLNVCFRAIAVIRLSIFTPVNITDS